MSWFCCEEQAKTGEEMLFPGPWSMTASVQRAENAALILCKLQENWIEPIELTQVEAGGSKKISPPG